MSQVFISYSRDDAATAERIRTALEAQQIRVWIDTQGIAAGAKWSRAIQDALDTCAVMIVVITPTSMDSRNVEDEWQYFLDEGKPIIPVLCEPAKPHFQLRRLQYVDFTNRAFDVAMADLLREVRRHIAAPPANDNLFMAAPPPRTLTDFMETIARVKTLLPPPFEWCYVPPGDVTLEALADAGDAQSQAAAGVHQVPEFAIAQYPITNAQYQAFVEHPAGWSDAKWWAQSEPARDWREAHPTPPAPAYPGDDLPRTNVSWYDAAAFCQWLTARLYKSPHLDAITFFFPMPGIKLVLPTEAQWQRAAQGGDTRRFPWGDAADVRRSNYLAAGHGKPMPVTTYEGGASPYGVMDMAGNAWEWCRPPVQHGRQAEPPARYPARGGSFANPPLDIRQRSVWSPTDALVDEGFRIIATLDAV